jgi:arylsulfatase A-like enzyme
MNRVDLLARILPAALLAVCCLYSNAARAFEPPNVLFIAVDDLNHWVTHLNRNQQARTPNIDRLATKGVTFNRAYCAVPSCNPARAALMSGLRPWTSACYTNGDAWKAFIPEGIGLAAQFKGAGYHVAGAGKIYHNQEHYPSEWTQYMPTDGYHLDGGESVDKMEGFHIPVNHDLRDEDLGDWHIVDWCIEQLSAERDQPLFLACGLYKPHLPFAVPRKYYEMFPIESIELPPYLESDLDDIPPAGWKMASPEGDHARILESGRWKDAIQAYLATCAYTDMNIGRLLDALEQSPIADNTVIVLWGDHGWSFGEKKNWRKFALWEEPTRAPLIWVAPGVTRPGTTCDHPVDFMTVYPTLCQLAGLAVPDHVEGGSILPLLKDPSAAAFHYAVTTHGFRNHAVRTSTHRLIQYADGSEELYDHTRDPYEWENLALRPESLSVLERLRRFLPPVEVQRPRNR